MKIAPTADPFNDRFEVISFTGIKRYDLILHTLYQGTHIHLDNVTATSVQSLEPWRWRMLRTIQSKGMCMCMIANAQHISFLPVKFSILPPANRLYTLEGLLLFQKIESMHFSLQEQG